MVDGQGNPLAIACGRANHHDQKFALKVVDKITVKGKIRRPKRLGADKGYDDDRFRKEQGFCYLMFAKYYLKKLAK